MTSSTFQLLPADFKCEPYTVVSKGSYTPLEFHKQEEREREQVVAVDAALQRTRTLVYEVGRQSPAYHKYQSWGALEIECHLTGRSVQLFLPREEGLTVHAVNQSPLVAFFGSPLSRILVHRVIEQHYYGDTLMLEDRHEMVFTREFSSLHLLRTCTTAEPIRVHTFSLGKSLKALAETLASA